MTLNMLSGSVEGVAILALQWKEEEKKVKKGKDKWDTQ